MEKIHIKEGEDKMAVFTLNNGSQYRVKLCNVERHKLTVNIHPGKLHIYPRYSNECDIAIEDS